MPLEQRQNMQSTPEQEQLKCFFWKYNTQTPRRITRANSGFQLFLQCAEYLVHLLVVGFVFWGGRVMGGGWFWMRERGIAGCKTKENEGKSCRFSSFLLSCFIVLIHVLPPLFTFYDCYCCLRRAAPCKSCKMMKVVNNDEAR